MKYWKAWVALSALVGWGAAQAEQRVDLYRVTELVTSQAADERARAASQAMARVLVRVTGDASVAQSSALTGYLAHAQHYVLQFGYSSTDQLIVDEAGKEWPAIALDFSFSETAVEKLLRQLQLPIWPANRPSTLVWLIEDQWPDGKVPVRDEAAIAALRAQAAVRGLPLQFPLWDLEDQMQASPDQLWQFERESLTRASARYQPNLILVGRYSVTSAGELRGVWQWLDGDSTDLLDAQAGDLQQLAAPVFDRLADSLAARYAIVPGRDASGQLLMRIDQVENFAHYRDILTYLEGLDALREAQLVRVEQGQLLIALWPEADLAHLQRALELDRKLTPLPTLVPADGSDTNPLLYRWYR